MNESLVLEHLHYADCIASRMNAHLAYRADLDDLIQDGRVGLLEASHKYDPSHGACFKTFSFTRIRGAMLDGLRRDFSWKKTAISFDPSYLDSVRDPDSGRQFRETFLEEQQSLLGKAFDNLPKRQRWIMDLYYVHELKISEIAMLLNLGISTVTMDRQAAEAAILSAIGTEGAYLPDLRR